VLRADQPDQEGRADGDVDRDEQRQGDPLAPAHDRLEGHLRTGAAAGPGRRSAWRARRTAPSPAGARQRQSVPCRAAAPTAVAARSAWSAAAARPEPHAASSSPRSRRPRPRGARAPYPAGVTTRDAAGAVHDENGGRTVAGMIGSGERTRTAALCRIPAHPCRRDRYLPDRPARPVAGGPASPTARRTRRPPRTIPVPDRLMRSAQWDYATRRTRDDAGSSRTAVLGGGRRRPPRPSA